MWHIILINKIKHFLVVCARKHQNIFIVTKIRWLYLETVMLVIVSQVHTHVCLCVVSDTPVSELSLELLLLQVVLPALLEQGHTRQWLKVLIRAWCIIAAWLLNLRSYLLGDVPLDEVSTLEMKYLCFGYLIVNYSARTVIN